MFQIYWSFQAVRRIRNLERPATALYTFLMRSQFLFPAVAFLCNSPLRLFSWLIPFGPVRLLIDSMELPLLFLFLEWVERLLNCEMLRLCLLLIFLTRRASLRAFSRSGVLLPLLCLFGKLLRLPLLALLFSLSDESLLLIFLAVRQLSEFTCRRVCFKIYLCVNMRICG